MSENAWFRYLSQQLAFHGSRQQNSRMIGDLVMPPLAAVLWVIGFSIVGKFFGVPRPPKFQERSGILRRLTFKQYACLYGALGWGVAIFVAFLVDDYLQGKLLSPGRVAFEAVIWLAAGYFFGWTVWGGYLIRHDSSLK